MKFQDIPADILTVRIKQTNYSEEPLKEQAVFSVDASINRPDEFEMLLKEAVVFFKPINKNDNQKLNSNLASGHAILAQLANPAVDGSIELQIAIFLGNCLEMGEVEIGVDEYVEKKMSKFERSRNMKGEVLYNKLVQSCCFQQGEIAFFFLTAGSAIDDLIRQLPQSKEDGEGKKDDSSESTNSYRTEPTEKNSFSITGEGIRFVATETARPDGKSIYSIAGLTDHMRGSDRALRLAKGKLSFVDWTMAGQIKTLAKAQMIELIKDESSYLKKWDEFGDLEGEILLKQARDVGALQYEMINENRDGSVSLRIIEAPSNALNALQTGGVSEVEIIDKLPKYLENKELTFKEFVGEIESHLEQEKLNERKFKNQEKGECYKVIGFEAASQSLTLETESIVKDLGMLMVSLRGDIAQIKRRMNARRAILEGRSAYPQLGLLIQEKGKIARIRRPQKIEPLSAFVRDKVFENQPTIMQVKAIEVALNTPDIAIIQGPPGTGKTTVITAILERLNEIADKRGVSVKGIVLLTGFQHDAVENMIDRISLNGIPVPKFGRRSGASLNDYNVFEQNLTEWCDQLAADIRSKNPQISEIEQEMDIRNLCLQYIQSPTRVLATKLVNDIASLGVAILGELISRVAANLAASLAVDEQYNDRDDRLINTIRRLRIRLASFTDDGAERATDALDELRDLLDDGEYELLDRVSLWRSEDGDPDFLEDLASLKKKLLIRYTAQPVFRVEKQNDEVIKLVREAIKCIETNGHSISDFKSVALSEFLSELESSPDGMVKAVSDYSFAFAATCQQSVNDIMQRQKGVNDKNTESVMEYEYVIVDEAARVSPRDLMIPMAQGKRIILVGDHRQLPHIIDEEVARVMEAGEVGESESDWLKKSMFQYLFSERLKTLEKNDGIKRTVTLDKQFRMHPLLGNFISRNFYERFNSIEKLASGRPESDFTHSLPGTDGKVAAWIDVPATQGRHQLSGTSWTRPAEASAIAHKLKEWMASDAGKDLSFGVISFYKAQAELIKKQLHELAVDEKKLRIGTVDSFQGMEFDVVILSMVRTSSTYSKTKGSNREEKARNLFGHLCLYNRLNVSMSRQKKLLIVVGDSSLLKDDLAQEYVPGLVDFYGMCQREGKIL